MPRVDGNAKKLPPSRRNSTHPTQGTPENKRGPAQNTRAPPRAILPPSGTPAPATVGWYPGRPAAFQGNRSPAGDPARAQIPAAAPGPQLPPEILRQHSPRARAGTQEGPQPSRTTGAPPEPPPALRPPQRPQGRSCRRRSFGSTPRSSCRSPGRGSGARSTPLVPRKARSLPGQPEPRRRSRPRSDPRSGPRAAAAESVRIRTPKQLPEIYQVDNPEIPRSGSGSAALTQGPRWYPGRPAAFQGNPGPAGDPRPHSEPRSGPQGRSCRRRSFGSTHPKQLPKRSQKR